MMGEPFPLARPTQYDFITPTARNRQAQLGWEKVVLVSAPNIQDVSICDQSVYTRTQLGTRKYKWQQRRTQTCSSAIRAWIVRTSIRLDNIRYLIATAGCWLLGAGRLLLAALCCLLVAGCLVLAAWCWLLVAVCLVLTACCWLLGAGCLLLAAWCWLLGAGCLVLAACCWLLGAGCLLLTALCWLLNAGCLLVDADFWLLGVG